MVKSYLRYEHALSFGVIASTDSNISHDSTGKLLLSPSLDNISAWDLKKGVLSKTLAPCSNPSRDLAVNSIAVRSSRLASGHADGSVRVWDLAKGICEATLNGHKSAVTALRFDSKGEVLASGSKDCDVIVWDVVGEAGLYRFRGHRDQVLDC